MAEPRARCIVSRNQVYTLHVIIGVFRLLPEGRGWVLTPPPVTTPVHVIHVYIVDSDLHYKLTLTNCWTVR